jgi:hypothetical protein
MRRVLALAALAACVAVPAARADGDPASDFLLSQTVFVPFDGKISAAHSAQLAAVVADAKQRGFTIRVALIVTRYDLGSVPSLWLHPHEYARFLSQELFFAYKHRVLVVMPNGYGVATRGKTLVKPQQLVDALPKPGNGGEAMTAAAVTAVRRLAVQERVLVPLPPLRAPASGSSTSRDRLVILGALVLAGGLAAGVILVRKLRAGGAR